MSRSRALRRSRPCRNQHLRVARWLQHNRSVRLLLALATLATGCFYMEPINERPSALIVRTDTAPAHRTKSTTVAARWSDPNDDAEPRFEWRAYACAAPGGVACDQSLTIATGSQV